VAIYSFEPVEERTSGEIQIGYQFFFIFLSFFIPSLAAFFPLHPSFVRVV